MLRTRLITAAVLIPIVAGLIYVGSLPYLALVAAAAFASQFEFVRLLARASFRPVHATGLVLVGLCLLDGWLPQGAFFSQGLALTLVLSLVWQVAYYPRSSVRQWTSSVASGLYVGTAASGLIRLRTLPEDGLACTLLVVAVALGADSMAYLVGSLWGTHKLAPDLSSGKSVEGYLAGILFGAVMGTAVGWLGKGGAAAGGRLTGARGLLVGILIAVLAPLGDLAISMVKREAGVKDSGRLLPGHGGVLDRIDSVLFAAVIGYASLIWMI